MQDGGTVDAGCTAGRLFYCREGTMAQLLLSWVIKQTPLNSTFSARPTGVCIYINIDKYSNVLVGGEVLLGHCVIYVQHAAMIDGYWTAPC